MILINDESGQILADGFIIDDADMGYDLYCTSWDMIEKDAQCVHAHLSRMFDSMIVYCRDACRGISRTIFIKSQKLRWSGY